VAPTRSLAAQAPAAPITPKAIPLPEQVHHPVAEETVERIAASVAVVESGPVKLVPTQPTKDLTVDEVRGVYGQIEDARTAGESGVDWEARFRQARSTEEITEIGKECKAAGSLTEDLKELGKELRSKIKAQK
jgi:hypothetical protein